MRYEAEYKIRTYTGYGKRVGTVKGNLERVISNRVTKWIEIKISLLMQITWNIIYQ